MQLFVVTLILLLLVGCASSAFGGLPGSARCPDQYPSDGLQLLVCSGTLIQGIFTPKLMSPTTHTTHTTHTTTQLAPILFTSQPSAFTITSLVSGFDRARRPSLSVLDYGSFTRIDLADPRPSTFLIASGNAFTNGADLPAYIELSAFAHFADIARTMPDIDPSVQHGTDDYADLYHDIAVAFSRLGMSQQTVDRHLSSAMTPFIQSPVAASLVKVSVALARAGFDSVSYPSAMPLHMTALQTAQHRDDVTVDL
eukprot:TRINITY_DN3860_c0_g2_i2.p1 TRINITY_DN3860_c0_g2~~TRINITY_DN3860_c0_g2_i2.p1  ORF type:complete len:282 (+),score=45.50 TRINITY_DN3860_c0_g2_i2:86-847(+)